MSLKKLLKLVPKTWECDRDEAHRAVRQFFKSAMTKFQRCDTDKSNNGKFAKKYHHPALGAEAVTEAERAFVLEFPGPYITTKTSGAAGKEVFELRLIMHC